MLSCWISKKKGVIELQNSIDEMLVNREEIELKKLRVLLLLSEFKWEDKLQMGFSHSEDSTTADELKLLLIADLDVWQVRVLLVVIDSEDGGRLWVWIGFDWEGELGFCGVWRMESGSDWEDMGYVVAEKNEISDRIRTVVGGGNGSGGVD